MAATIFFIVWSLVMLFIGALYGFIKAIDAPEKRVASIKESMKRTRELTKEIQETKKEQKMLKAEIKEAKKKLKQFKRGR